MTESEHGWKPAALAYVEPILNCYGRSTVKERVPTQAVVHSPYTL
jgi:hypothetical protein